MKRLILILIAFMIVAKVAHASDCRLEREVLRGEFYYQCPRGSYVVASRTNHVGNFTYTYVRCEEIKLVCEGEQNDKINESQSQEDFQE